MGKDAVINLRIDSQLKRKLQEKCHDKRLKMTEAIEQALEQWLDDDSTQSTQSTQNNESAATQVNCDRAEIDQLQQQINQLQATLDNQSDNANLAQRLEKLEKRQSENYQAIAKLQDTCPPLAENTKQLKEDVRELKNETQALKINRASMNDIRNLEVVLEQKIDSQQLDERLALATMPIGETIDGNQNNAQQAKTAIGEQIKAVNPNNTAPKESKAGNKTKPTEQDLEQMAQEIKDEYGTILSNQTKLEELIAKKLIAHKFKPKDYLPKKQISDWKKNKIPKDDGVHYFAYLIWSKLT